MDRELRLRVVVELMQSGFKQAADGLIEYLLDCHPDERPLVVDVIAWFERQSAHADTTTASCIESGVFSR